MNAQGITDAGAVARISGAFPDLKDGPWYIKRVIKSDKTVGVVTIVHAPSRSGWHLTDAHMQGFVHGGSLDGFTPVQEPPPALPKWKRPMAALRAGVLAFFKELRGR